ncbi:MAG: PQQ-dependent dehydrogenase, methanol/ethanol family [Pseudomonadota bacterium]|nr:PQQ-dependent dehydrogenase, methanol/ethanol family [Pseudomonadota bacterium]
MNARTRYTLLALACACGSFAQAQTNADLANAATGTDWLTYGHDYAETRFSTLTQVNVDNVDELGVAWTFDTDSFRGLEATPLVKDGVLYATRPWSSVFALDARTGAKLWDYDPQVDKSIGWKACCDVVNRGVALYEDKVYVGAIDGRLIALDARTGEELWSVQTTDPERPYTITGAPRIADGKVIIGNGGSELGVRGYVTAYDANTGEEAWRFWVVPGNPADGFENPDMEFAATTWAGNWWEVGGGGTSWDSIVYDPEARLVYVGTGNGAPWSHEIRSAGEGDNLFLSSIVALSVDTGRVAWHYQTTPADNWDYTAVQGLMQAELVIDGVERKVIMQAPKNGFFYVLDRLTGELLSAQPYAEVTWASGVSMETGRPIETPQARYEDAISIISPGPGGAHNWHPMSFSPLTGLVYLPSQQGSRFNYVVDPNYEYKPGTWNTGLPFGSTAGISQRPEEAYAAGTGPAPETPGALLAWDPLTNKPRWQVNYPFPALGGTLTTAGNLVFHGVGDGHFYAYRADNGERVWDVDLGVSIMAPPITYMLDGKQYISVLAGWGGATGLFGVNFSGEYKPEGRLWTFVLGGDTNIVPVSGQPLPELTAIPFDNSPAVQALGADLYGQRCAMCHGRNVAGGGALADLRYAAPATYDIFHDIVRRGAYTGLGMPNLGAFLNEAEAEAIKQYILGRRAALME